MIPRAGRRALHRHRAHCSLRDIGGGWLNEGAVRRGRRTPIPWGPGCRTVARNSLLAPPRAASDAAREPSPEGLKDSFPQVLDRGLTTKSRELMVPRGSRAQGRVGTHGSSLVGRRGAPLLASLFAGAGFLTNRVSAISLPGSPRLQQ